METAAATAIALPDEVFREILVRVADPTALFRLAMACKRWCALIVDSSFLRRRWPEDSPNSSTLAGFFAAETNGGRSVFVSAPRSPISSSRCFLSSFYEAAGFLDNAVLLTSRRGLLLVQISQREYGEPNQLAVCNVLAGTCDVLPPLPHNVNLSISGYTVLTATDCSSNGGHRPPPSPGPGYSSFFKVLIHGVNIDGARQRYYLSMFSSDELSWTEPQVCLDHDDIRKAHGRSSAVVRRGTAHWLFNCTSNFYTLNVSADTGHVSLTKLLIRSGPFDTLAPQLSIAADGTMALLHLRRDGSHIDIWTCQETGSEGGAAEWLRTRILELKRPKSPLNYTFSICAGERSNMLFFIDPFEHVANLQTGTTQDVRGQFKGLDSESTIPLMVDWPSLFMSRLGDSEKRCMWYNL
ncbi:hypothetical protein ACQ4PT_008605 [Festuca glaucescens]